MKKFKPLILAFLCENSAYRAIDVASMRKVSYLESIRVIKVPCSGRISSTHILQAFSNGADGVIIFGCLKGGCNYVDGNLRAQLRVKKLKKILDIIGLGGERLEMHLVGFCEAGKILEYMNNFYMKIREIGPNPLKSKGVFK
ncbi:MAG: hypothetical protein DRO23_05605 [Thermoprotei archaeon]|nr:MAG: hypothetical protein DRO23_05605 [Thermoprotei archaeon]